MVSRFSTCVQPLSNSPWRLIGPLLGAGTKRPAQPSSIPSVERTAAARCETEGGIVSPGVRGATGPMEAGTGCRGQPNTPKQSSKQAATTLKVIRCLFEQRSLYLASPVTRTSGINKAAFIHLMRFFEMVPRFLSEDAGVRAAQLRLRLRASR